MMEWVEYMTSDADSPIANLRRKNGREKPWQLTYFGVGNESWGCGGNMTPEYYAEQYRRYNTFVKNYGGSRCSGSPVAQWRRLQMDGVADGERWQPHERPLASLLHRPHRQLAEQGLRHAI